MKDLFTKGKKYQGRVTGAIYTCDHVADDYVVLRSENDAMHIASRTSSGLYQKYVEPPKPIKVRTVVARDKRDGYQAFAVSCTSEEERFSVPDWPRFVRNSKLYEIISETITEITTEK